MAKVNHDWKVLPHRPIEQLAENLWRVQGSLEGMAIRRVMTLVRRASGELVIHNGIALDEESMASIEGWGKPATILVPNGYHRLDAPAFASRYPDAKVLVHAGYSHVLETASERWYPMALYFREITGIDPVTVDDTLTKPLFDFGRSRLLDGIFAFLL